AEIDLTTPSGAAGTSDVQVIAGGVTSTANPPADYYTYQQPAPTITSVSPDSGQESGGAPSVTIGGTDFSGSGFTTSGVSFGGNPATPFTVNSASSITATPPAGTGQVDVTVTTQSTDGTSTLTSATGAADTYAYAPVPSVSNVAPGTGPTGGGNTVTLTGTGFMSSYGAGANYSATDVMVDTTDVGTTPCGGSPTSPCFDITNSTHISVQDMPAHIAGTVDITVSTPGGTSPVNSNDQYTYAVLPTVTGVAPGAGSAAGGNTVFVTGTGFTGATDVFVGTHGISAMCPAGSSPCFTLDSSTQITVQNFPAHAAGTVDVTVVTPVGTSATTPADQYIYASSPTVTSVSPSFGALVGGNTVNVDGTGFDTAGVAATQVSVGTTNITTACSGTPVAPCFSVVSDNQITVEDFPSAALPGSVHITVTGAGGTSATSGADTYTYLPAPTVTGVAPPTGPTGGGNTIVVTGTAFESSGEFTTTSVLVGPHNVTVSPCPVTPTAACFTVNSATQLTVEDIPAHAVGAVDIVVTTPEGTSPISQPADQYTYEPIPAVTGISPLAGVVAGGNTVIVTGTLFTGATAVSVGGTNITTVPCPVSPTAPCFTVNSATQITIMDFPSGSAGTVDITVTTSGGTSPTSAADVYAYAPIPTITKVAPNHGSTSGGTSVTVTGTGFEPTGTNRNFTTTSVTVGTTSIVVQPCPGAPTAPCYNVNSSTQLFIEDFPAGSGTVNITATTVGGTSAVTTSDRYFYGATFPTVTFLSQRYGAQKGGAVVNITGTNFSSTGGITVSDVFFGSLDVPASNAFPCTAGCFTVVGPGLITAYTPAAGAAGAVDVTVQTSIGTSGVSAADLYTYVPSGAYTALSPFRVCDTRASRTPDECTGKTLGAGGRVTVQVTGVAGPSAQMVPTGAQAVVVNLTAINHSATHTYVTAFPAGSVPVASNMNLDPDAVQSNLAIVQLTSGGAITVYNPVGVVDVIVDIQGYFATPSAGPTPPGEFHSIAPIRMCDTRANHHTQCAGATNNPLPANTWRKIVLSGTGSIPVTGAAAVVFNLTATQGTLSTYLAVAPPNASDQCPTGAQGASILNPRAGISLPNRVISPLGPANDVCVYNAAGSIEFIIDVGGWFGKGGEAGGSLFYSVPPTRICDTRGGTGTHCSGQTLLPNFKELVQVAGTVAVPAFLSAQPAAVVANLTGIAGTQSTYLELYPGDHAQPEASDLNPAARDVIANLAIVGIGQAAGATQGDVYLYNGLGDINAILDVAGWFQ
ncbi:MAG: IPT/TIG domain-containing protein, partial [Candidatus Dormiibacterota bacterium]